MSSILDENTSARTLRSGKAAVGLTTRRALGEIGNRQLGGNVAAKKPTTARSVLSNVTSRASSIVRPKPVEQELTLDLPLERMLFSPKNNLADIDLPVQFFASFVVILPLCVKFVRIAMTAWPAQNTSRRSWSSTSRTRKPSVRQQTTCRSRPM